MGFYALVAALGTIPPPVLSLPETASKEWYTQSITTNPITATVEQGTPPFTFAWVKLSGDAIVINSPNSQTTTFFTTDLQHGASRVATFRCTVTDALDRSASDTIVVTITRWATLSVESPLSVNKDASTSTVTSDPVSMVITGGSGDYVVLWQKDSGGAITALTPYSVTTQFRATGMNIGESRTAWFWAGVHDNVTDENAESLTSVTLHRVP